MKLFHRTITERASSILRDGFKDRTDPTGTNLGFYSQIPEIKAVWFSDVPLNDEGGDLLLLEIPDAVVQQLNATVRMGYWAQSSLPHFNRYRAQDPEIDQSYQGVSKIEDRNTYTEYLIPAEIANRYGPPINVTNIEEEFLPNRGMF